MSNDSIGKTFLVAIILCIVCSVLVSTAAVKLKPIQDSNKAKFTRSNILKAAGLYKPGQNTAEAFKNIRATTVAQAQEDLGITVMVEQVNEIASALQQHDVLDANQTERIKKAEQMYVQHDKWIEAFEAAQRQYQTDMARMQQHQNATDARVEKLADKTEANQRIIMSMLQGDSP